MVAKRYHKNRFVSTSFSLINKSLLIREKKNIISNYDFINCKISNKKLVCIGKVKPTIHSVEYTFRIVYDGWYAPVVHILRPEIKYNDDIHMYPSNNSLCLFHPEKDNFKWNYKKHNIHDTIIPWTVEWFTYYELYLITGKWEHPEIKHTESEKN